MIIRGKARSSWHRDNPNHLNNLQCIRNQTSLASDLLVAAFALAGDRKFNARTYKFSPSIRIKMRTVRQDRSSNEMRQGLLWIVIVGAAIAAALYFGAPASTVLIVALLVICCGGMMFGMGRMNGEHKRKTP